MAISTQFSFDTKLSADSVEWCPNPGHENLLAVGTYQVQKDEAQEFSDDQRFGRIYLFVEDQENYEVVLSDIFKVELLGFSSTASFALLKYLPRRTFPTKLIS